MNAQPVALTASASHIPGSVLLDVLWDDGVTARYRLDPCRPLAGRLSVGITTDAGWVRWPSLYVLGILSTVDMGPGTYGDAWIVPGPALAPFLPATR